MEHQQKNIKSKRLYGKIPLFIILTVVLFSLGSVFFVGYFVSNDYWAIIELNIKVEATLTNEIYTKKVNTHTYNFVNVYDYISNEGTKYSGNYYLQYSTRAQAEAHIGEKITIYIDGKGNSAVKKDDATNVALIFIPLFIIFTLASITIFIIFLLPHKWKPLPGKSKWVKYNP